MMSIDSNGINPIYFKNDSWFQSRDYVVATPTTKNPIKRLKFINNGATVFGGGSYTFRNSPDTTDIVSIDNLGNITQKGTTIDSTYQLISGMSSYQTTAGMNSYLTTANASTTYQTILSANQSSPFYIGATTSKKVKINTGAFLTFITNDITANSGTLIVSNPNPFTSTTG